jgi:RND family efflux transporter MFP subunit
LLYYFLAYRPAHAAQQAVLQTTLARRGNIVLSASGSGTLQAANQVDLGFKTSGTLTKVDVKVGDHVSEGQVLAELDNTSQQLALVQAKQNLAGLTSTAAVASAQQAIAQAQLDLQSARTHLMYLISPPVYYWENEVSKAQQTVRDAQAAASAAPSDTQAKAKLKEAQDALTSAQGHLTGAQASYEKTYVPNNFVYHTFNTATRRSEKYVSPPNEAEVLAARSAVTVAQGALTDAQNLYAALTGGDTPADASGTGLANLRQAQASVQTAQDNLAATQIIAPFSGTVTSVTAQVGDTVAATALLTVADLSKLYVQTYVDESDYSMFKAGNQAQVVFDALPDQTFTGRVVQVSPALDTSSGSPAVSGLVELDPTNADLLIGMSGSVEVVAGQTDGAVLIPITALHEYAPGKYAVFVRRNGTLAVQFVDVGLQDQVNAEIKSGLQPGDVVSTGLAGTRQQ